MSPTLLTRPPDLVERFVAPDGKPGLRMNFHPGQRAAWRSERRIVLVLAGTQSGKTAFGPHWLYREIRRRGPGDYFVVTPTFPLLELKALPAFKALFEQMLRLGEYVASPIRKFVFSEAGAARTFGPAETFAERYPRDDPATPTNVYFGHAADPDALESATVKAAWLDEAGQKRFKLASWEAVMRRLALAMGRVLITTTPYDLGWLKQQIWDKWRLGDPSIDVVRFDSTENPAFPREDFERAERDLPRWKFDLFYRAIFTRPAGMIYDCWDTQRNVVKPFPIPASWQRFVGLDFGQVNFAATFFARPPSSPVLYLYREYRPAGGRSVKDHVAAILQGEPRVPTAIGGAPSEDDWRRSLGANGLPTIRPPISDVELGIDRVYGAIKNRELVVFDSCTHWLAEVESYSRVVDDRGEPTTEIDDKASYHLLDATRYPLSYLLPQRRLLSEQPTEFRTVAPGQPEAPRTGLGSGLLGQARRDYWRELAEQARRETNPMGASR